MFIKELLKLAVIALLLTNVCGTTFAGPTATVNGVTFPVGAVAGGNTLQSGILDETLITAVGQSFTGVGRVDSINDAASTQVWGNGQAGIELVFVFSGYTATSVAYPNLAFNGGNITFYTLPAGTAINNLGSVSADVAAVRSGTLWLSESGVPEDAAGDTLVSNIVTGTSLSNFSTAFGSGFLDVTGGPAAPYFATKTFVNLFDIANGEASDETFSSDFSTGAVGNFDVSGSGTIKANAISEPFSIGLLGIGLLSLGVVRRQRY